MNTPEKFIETLRAQQRILRECAQNLDMAEDVINNKKISNNVANDQIVEQWLVAAMASALKVYNNLNELYSQQIITKV